MKDYQKKYLKYKMKYFKKQYGGVGEICDCDCDCGCVEGEDCTCDNSHLPDDSIKINISEYDITRCTKCEEVICLKKSSDKKWTTDITGVSIPESFWTSNPMKQEIIDCCRDKIQARRKENCNKLKQSIDTLNQNKNNLSNPTQSKSLSSNSSTLRTTAQIDYDNQIKELRTQMTSQGCQ